MFTVLSIIFPVMSLFIGVAVFVATIRYVKVILAAPKDSNIAKS